MSIFKTNFVIAILVLYGPLATLGQDVCDGQQCPEKAHSEGNVLLQIKASITPVEAVPHVSFDQTVGEGTDGEADDAHGTETDINRTEASQDSIQLSSAPAAQFLMQSTFGPTRAGLKELESGTYEHWIKNQINTVPAEPHREYYRSRVNPHWNKRSGLTGLEAWRFRLVKSDVQCKSKDTALKNAASAEKCATILGEKYGKGFFIHGKDRKKYQCRRELTDSAICTEGFEKGSFDFYEVTGKEVYESKFYKERAACSQGSRWYNYVFKRDDVGQKVKVTNGQISIGEDVQSDINPASPSPRTCTEVVPRSLSRRGKKCSDMSSRLCSRDSFKGNKWCQQSCFDRGNRYGKDDCSSGWGGYADGKKSEDYFICRVEDYVGGVVAFGKSDACKANELIHMVNPAVWQKEVSKATKYNDMMRNPLVPDVIFLKADSPNCGLSSTSIVEYEGKYFLHDARMELVANTVNSPKIGAPKHILNKDGCSLVGDTVACGSPGETANVGENGNLFPFVTNFDPTKQLTPHKYMWDKFSDSDNGGSMKRALMLVKSTVWTMKALQGNDQLRQRLAWSLSQILVCAVPGASLNTYYTESWLNYYDIFVRNAFGNFRDVLQQVTYSPLMGTYLTYRDSRSYDASKSYPDENYAREVMQLFTIGVDKLNDDGTIVTEKDDEGNELEVPAYTNEHIMNFARVFTGFHTQPLRSNIEALNARHNLVDPMRVNTDLHDRYPKPDLDGNFLGDGYPLCADLPKQGFLKEGARYEFLGASYDGHAVDLGTHSALASALSNPAMTVILNNDVTCTGEECSLYLIDVVKVENGFYEYVAPTCVHHFFYTNGNKIQHNRWSRRSECANPSEPAAGFACCRGCSNAANGWLKRKGWTCDGANGRFLKRACTSRFWKSRKYCAAACAKHGAGYEGMNCSAGEHSETLHPRLASFSSAQAQCTKEGASLCIPQERSDRTLSLDYRWTADACKTKIMVHEDGGVSAYTKYHAPNKFSVKWAGDQGAPKEASYFAEVQSRQVFAAVPKKDELSKLKIGALKPESTCTDNCDGDVKVYSAGAGTIDENTVFECDGRFLKNAKSIVEVKAIGVTHTFRNPPVFLTWRSGKHQARSRERAVFAEVESLIDVLFHHPNTPVNIARKLIQRLVTSNPSPDYIKAVSNAFKTGAYGDLKFSGKYGDLGATVAGILLHSEARTQSSPSDGLLREPMLKIMHLMRSMEYKDWEQSPIILKNLAEDIGQFPFWSETVFNFYNDDYAPPGLSVGLVAPEFQIYTSPFAISLLNLFDGLLARGVSYCGDAFGYRNEKSVCKTGSLSALDASDTHAKAISSRLVKSDVECKSRHKWVGRKASLEECAIAVGKLGGHFLIFGKGRSKGWCGQEYTKSATCTEGFKGRNGRYDFYTIEAKADATKLNNAVTELNVLLTGGRFTSVDSDVVKKKYQESKVGEELSAAVSATLMTPAFNTLGNTQPAGYRAEKPPVHQEAVAATYKAVVMLFFLGGADTYQMLVPRDCDLHDEYREVRKGIDLSIKDLLPISAKTQKCKNFGINPNMPKLHKMYQDGEAAFVSNVGSLTQPMNRSGLRGGAMKSCPSQFSHGHATAIAQMYSCNTVSAAPHGIGGLMADALGKKNMNTASFSVGRTAKWTEGATTNTEVLDMSRGAVRYKNHDNSIDAVVDIGSQKYSNVYCEEYAKQFVHAINSSEYLGDQLDSIDSRTLDKYIQNEHLERQLYQVARIIQTRTARKADRDFFFVTLGGWDMHQGIVDLLPGKFKAVDDALAGFVQELKAQQIFESVVLVTESDFGRTLSYNGAGTDHGWGGNHIILGGGINGGEIYNEFLGTFKLSSKWDASNGRGRVIPKYPWESMMVPIAEWMGVDDMDPIFVNLKNFDRDQHIIKTSDLFKAL